MKKINKAYMMLGIIKRNFVYISRNCFVTLYKSLVRSLLEYKTVYIQKEKQRLSDHVVSAETVNSFNRQIVV